MKGESGRKERKMLKIKTGASLESLWENVQRKGGSHRRTEAMEKREMESVS